MTRPLPLAIPALLGLAALAGCGKGDGKTEALDKQIVAGAGQAKAGTDPAMTGALADQIVVDPALAGRSGARRARPAAPRQTAASSDMTPAADAATGQAMLHAPDPVPADKAARRGLTLGELARAPATPVARKTKCDKTFRYGAAWADRLPAAVPLYPGAAVSEAAGNDSPGCQVRIVSFTSGAPVRRVIDWYYTHAVRAGYSAEHQIANADHILGGAREADGSAYYITVAPRDGGGSDVDIVANHGR